MRRIRKEIKLRTVKFQGLSGSADRRSNKTPVGIYLQNTRTTFNQQITINFRVCATNTSSEDLLKQGSQMLVR